MVGALCMTDQPAEGEKNSKHQNVCCPPKKKEKCVCPQQKKPLREKATQIKRSFLKILDQLNYWRKQLLPLKQTLIHIN